MAIQAILLKQPHEVSFTGNPMPFIWSIAPYTSNEAAQDIRLIVKIEVEVNFGSNVFEEVKSQTYYPAADGKITVDVRKVIHPYLEYTTPNPSLLKPLQAQAQRKRYRVAYLLQKNQSVGSTQYSNVLYAIKGGLSYDQWHPKNFFEIVVGENHQPFIFDPKRTIHHDEPRFLFWTYPYTDNSPQTVDIQITREDGFVSNYQLPKISCGKWGVCFAPIGYNQLDLQSKIPAGSIAVSYRVRVVNDDEVEIVAWQNYVLEHRNFYNTHTLVYRTSMGSMECLTLRGQIDLEADYTRQNIQQKSPPDYLKEMILKSQTNDVNTIETPKFKGDTGFLSREATDRLRDFFLSPQKFEYLPASENNKAALVPVTLDLKNAKFYANNENLVTTVIEWKRGYGNEFYTPLTLVPLTKEVCPAVEFLQVIQINKNTLQIIWALEAPYDKIQITISTSDGDTTFVLTGNSGSINQPFENPVEGDETEEISITGKTICDENSVPPDLGPGLTVTLVIGGNSLPVAVEDHYYLNVGYNTPQRLTPSPLANDYDPDGDPFEAVPVTGGASDAGGTYTLWSDGTLDYLPPSSVFLGDDHITYEIFETPSGTPVEGDIYIHIGGVLGNVYAKIVQRNLQSSGSGYENTTYAEVWIDFFSDPAGSVPVDITALNLTLNVNQHFQELHLDGSGGAVDTHQEFLGVGTKIKIFEGIIAYSLYDTAYPSPEQYSYTHTLEAGTGYIII